jgi:alpha-tubulin suppressor-like RCC1 family protein
VFLSLLAIAASACGARTGLDSSNTLDASATPGGAVTGLLAISAGRSHTCALRSNGTVVCWGNDSVGQLGNGTTNELTNDPVTVSNLTDAVAISAGPDFTCALRSGGTIVCWGSDTLGYLAPGPMHPSLVPAAVDGVADVKAVAAGLGSICALSSDGTVSCWGTLAGQVEPKPEPALSGALAIGTSGDDTCGLLAGGTVNCVYGTLENLSMPTRIPSVEGATAITVATDAAEGVSVRRNASLRQARSSVNFSRACRG